MRKRLFLFFLLIFSECFLPLWSESEGKHVFLTILARNKGHELPTFLNSIENLDYCKKDITIYINTNNNCDNTESILIAWAKEKEAEYKKIIFEKNDIQNLSFKSPHEWTKDRLKTLALIRNRSFQLALENNCDYYFIVDCDNFIIPSTLSDLVAKDLPIVAPMLVSIPEPNDINSNFFAAVDSAGFFMRAPEYSDIFYRKKIGTFKVPLVHCTYLIKREFLDKLSYTDDTDDYEFIIFSRIARKNKINQYICNEKKYGYNINYFKKLSLEEERDNFTTLIPHINELILEKVLGTCESKCS